MSESKHTKTLIVKIDREKKIGEATNGAVVSQFDPEKNVIKLKFGRNIQKYV